MRGVNKVILVGTLGKDPESKNFPNGGILTNFSIATSESWTDKNSGERKENTEWHRITCHNRLGEIAQQYLKKGSKVYIEGSLRTRQWTDQNGQERYTTEIRAEQMQMLDSNNSNNQQGSGQAQGGYTPNQSNNQGQGAYGQNGYGNNQNQRPAQQSQANGNQTARNNQNPNQGYGRVNQNPPQNMNQNIDNSIDDDLPF